MGLLSGIGGIRLARLSLVEPGVAGAIGDIGSPAPKYEARLEPADGGERGLDGLVSLKTGGGATLDGGASSASEPSKE